MTGPLRICLIPGDGIGPEITAEAVKVLDVLGARHGVAFEYERALLGGVAIDETGSPLPEETLRVAKRADAVLLAAIGGPKWDTTDPDKPRPEQGLLGMRKSLELYANLRPVRIFPALRDASSLKPEFLEGVDMLIVRELTGGLYFGDRARERDVPGAAVGGGPGMRAYDTMEYREFEIERIARVAFEAARGRGNRVHSVDKANVLESSRLWREVVHRLHETDFADVELVDQLVDNSAMQLIRNPAQYDVMVTENMFGDILSDEASMLAGSLGMLASASLGDSTALYEPSHGSAPDIAGQGVANPLAMLLSVELMLRYSFFMDDAADGLAAAIERVLDDGWRTRDIAGQDIPPDRVLGTSAMGDAVLERLA
ncbi:MAG: 3-isopropylmalate dehydrogenase [Actinomycetota bacterium]|nr:3-isopropylmalate dehydrogenase [Actinomycetota bacterium]